LFSLGLVKHEARSALRYIIATLLLGCSLLWAGPCIHAASYSGFLVAALLVGLVVYVCCRLYPRHPFSCGFIVATCFALSLRVDDSRMYSRVRQIVWGEILHPWGDALLVYGYCLFFAVLVATVFYLRQRKAAG
jgi:hypothetical protein